VVYLPGADKKSDLEPRLTRSPAAWKDDPAHIGTDPIGEATVARQSDHQVAEELVVAELELQGHLQLIVIDSAPLLPA
jgi:hypothetical protein